MEDAFCVEVDALRTRHLRPLHHDSPDDLSYVLTGGEGAIRNAKESCQRVNAGVDYGLQPQLSADVLGKVTRHSTLGEGLYELPALIESDAFHGSDECLSRTGVEDLARPNEGHSLACHASQDLFRSFGKNLLIPQPVLQGEERRFLPVGLEFPDRLRSIVGLHRHQYDLWGGVRWQSFHRLGANDKFSPSTDLEAVLPDGLHVGPAADQSNIVFLG